MALLKFLVITICILWLLRVIARMLLPVLFKKAASHMSEKMHNQQQQYQQQARPRRPEGKVEVDYIPNKKNDHLNYDKAGEFVDYEEVKEK